MDERRENCKLHAERLLILKQELDEVKDTINFMKKLLIGNGIIGVAEQARRSFEFMIQSKQTRSGWMDWVFRLVITAMLTYLMMR